MEVCNGYVTAYVARWLHKDQFPGQEPFALQSGASYYNALVPTLEGGVVVKVKGAV